jgi:hypothetical protein
MEWSLKSPKGIETRKRRGARRKRGILRLKPEPRVFGLATRLVVMLAFEAE